MCSIILRISQLNCSITQRTGVHSVADVFCLGCNERLGWFYHKAADHLQKYKEGTYLLFEYNFLYYLTEIWPGKFLLEREKLVKENAWTLDDAAAD